MLHTAHGSCRTRWATLPVFHARATTRAVTSARARHSHTHAHGPAIDSANLYDVLSSRGFVAATTHSHPLVRQHFSQPRTLYAGFDPTADSLHIGNLLVLMALRHAKRLGHRCLCVVGGATGAIGDPSGRNTQRTQLSLDTIAANLTGIQANIHTVIDTITSDSGSGRDHGGQSVMLNNSDWTASLSLLDFLRDVAIHFRVNTMLAKTSVQSRLQSSGLSFTEFSYSLLQGYDWYHLHREYQCSVQIGGSDQWGNITAGIELIEKKTKTVTNTHTDTNSDSAGDQYRDVGVYGLTLPLLTTANGEKFGKSAGNAIWLTPAKTSPYHFYQHWLRTDDRDTSKFLRLFTELSLADIATIEQTMSPRERLAVLAREVTRIVHGESGLKHALAATETMFYTGSNDINQSMVGVPSASVARSSVVGHSVSHLALTVGAVASKAEARRLITNGGLYVNDARIISDRQLIDETLVSADASVIRVRVGKKAHYIVRLCD